MKLLLTRQSSLVRKVAFGGIFGALSFVVTFFFPMIMPFLSLTSIGGSGYLNFGDSVVLLSALLSTSVYAPFGAALGAALADVILFPLYAPFTLAIKLMEAFVAGILFRALQKRVATPMCPGRPGLPTIPSLIVACLFGGVVMALGYFVSEATILTALQSGFGWQVAIVDLPWNTLQGVAGAILAILLYPAVSRAAPEA